jgi:hypothetical protein
MTYRPPPRQSRVFVSVLDRGGRIAGEQLQLRPCLRQEERERGRRATVLHEYYQPPHEVRPE